MDDTVDQLEAVNVPDDASGGRQLLGRPGRWRLLVGCVVFGLVVACATIIGFRHGTPYPYLLPWIVGTAAVMLGVALTTPDDRRSDLLDPVVFAMVTYFLPFAVVGSMLFAGGWTDPFYTALIPDPRHNLPLAQIYLTIGILALALGSRVRVASRLGAWLARSAPSVGLEQRRIGIGLIVVHLLGIAGTYWSFESGFVGYQNISPTSGSALPAYVATIMIPARIGLGMAWIRAGSPRPAPIRVAAGVSAGVLPIEMALGATRATLVLAAMSIGFGALAAGWRPRLGRLALAATVGAVAVMFSIAFATTFRELKNPEGVERTVGIGEQLDLGLEAASQTIRRGPLVVTDALAISADRLETTGQVAVVVSQYRSLRGEELEAGIDNSVADAIIAGAIPRFVWPGKPNPPDPRTLSTIYFQFSGNSFATTPMTDLLRNFGPFGVFAGMALLGTALGVLGAFRRIRDSSIATNMVVGAVLIRGISYEGFYGAIASDSVRVAFVAVVAALVIRVVSTQDVPISERTDGPSPPLRAAVVTVDLAQRGGHQGVATYLQDCLESRGIEVSLISLATSAEDRNSVQFRSPATWRGPTVTDESFDGRAYRHVGSWLSEATFMRVRPRAILDRELQDHDIIVLGVGSPFWGVVIPLELRERTIVEFVTRYQAETESAVEAATGWRKIYWALQRRIVALQEQRSLETAGATVVPSSALADWASSSGSADVTIIPHAISDRFEPDDEDPGTSIVAVARWVDPRKNFPLLLDAYARAIALDDTVGPLILIGTPPSMQILDAEAKTIRELGDRIRILGETNPDRLVEALQSARIAVLPSDQEGFGLPLVEAMACGCAVVATRSVGSELTVVDGLNGLLVPRRDAAALAAAIVRLSSDDELHMALSEGALSEVTRYRVDRVAPQLVSVVDRVAERSAQLDISASREAIVDAS
jgi:glycosyltransferase involved in cell wall biosynthesis